MIIAIDHAIPYWKEAFSGLGDIRLFMGRNLKPADVRDVDALIVRTITPVNASLLEGSAVRFVGGASAGIDHIDQDYLKGHGIYFSYAAGCNANAVSEYVVTALHVIASWRGWDLKSKSIAVVGVGNVGSRVAKKAKALGMKVLLCDPPLRDLTGDTQYRDLEDVFGADILSFHVPLAMEGPYPTWHMIDRANLDLLSPWQFLINSSRGAVIDNEALKSALLERRMAGAVLDVWEEEPQVDYSLLKLLDIGTPHIAGISFDGKIRATEMVREDLCRFFGIQSSWDTNPFYPESGLIGLEQQTSEQDALLSVLLQVFDIIKDDKDLRGLGLIAAGEAAAGFDRLRNNHPLRPEFDHFIVDLSRQNSNLSSTVASLGFKLKV